MASRQATPSAAITAATCKPAVQSPADTVVRALLAPRGVVDASLVGRAAQLAAQVGRDVTTGERDRLLEVEVVVPASRVDEVLALLEQRLGVPQQTDRWVLAG